MTMTASAAYVMWSNVNVPQLLRIAFTDTLNVLQQDVLKARIEHLKQCVPVSNNNNKSNP